DQRNRSRQRPTVRPAVETLEDRRVPAVILSDSFSRADANQYHLGSPDNALGGSGTHYYLPLFGTFAQGAGATLDFNTLRNHFEANQNSSGFGGVELSAMPPEDPAQGGFISSGENLGQDLNVAVDLTVPTDAGRSTKGGIYFRAPAHQQGQDIGGP